MANNVYIYIYTDTYRLLHNSGYAIEDNYRCTWIDVLINFLSYFLYKPTLVVHSYTSGSTIIVDLLNIIVILCE